MQIADANRSVLVEGDPSANHSSNQLDKIENKYSRRKRK